MNKLIYPTHESLYFQNSLAHIVEYPGRYVRVDWLAAPMFSPHLREAYEQLLLLLTETRLHKVLSDHQLMPAIMPHDQDWLLRNWLPRAVQEAGYRCCAVVDSLAIYNQLATTRMAQQVRGSQVLQVAHFLDPLSAARWLQQAG